MKTTYSCLVIIRENALWAIETAIGNGLYNEARRYLTIMNRIENAMFNYKALNL